MAKYTIKDMEKIAETHGGKCLSQNYINNKSKLLWRCSKKHQWSSRPDLVIRGSWCPYCANRVKQNINDCKYFAEKKGGKCLSSIYINSSTNILWQCNQGHEWFAPLSRIKSGAWCPHCYGNVKHNIRYMKEMAKRFGGECLSTEYKGNKIKLTWKCSLGHIWDAMPNSVIMGHWCKKCGMKRAGIKNRYSFEELHEMAKKRGGVMLSKGFRNGKIKLRWLCEDGHEFKMTPIMVKQGQWCPECSTGKSERICRMYFEAMFSKKFPKIKPNWLVSPTGHRMELDGYCEELKLAFEYQGPQHYNNHKIFGRGISFENRKEYDIIKRKVCAQKGIMLIEIPYTVNYELLKRFILKRCKVNNIIVPNENVTINPYEVYSPKRLQEIQHLAQQNWGECLSKKYIDNNTKLKFRCKNGHEWETIPKVIRRGNWCKICSGNAKSNISEMQKLAQNKEGECLSKEYVNTISKLEWKCKEGHTWKATPISIKRGSWCPLCSHKITANKLKLSLKEFKEIAKSKEGECLSTEYVNNKTKLKWKCSKGHEWWRKPEHIKKGYWCPMCMSKRNS